ncbi:hypothetical protein LCGC14_2153330 [marine sediment metagenome]|uniref:Uncharacterized protein n=1 Tax=marine sediment metagenome TaxID=412755 RepID=A0A0F9DUT4_9ZZZZ
MKDLEELDKKTLWDITMKGTIYLTQLVLGVFLVCIGIGYIWISVYVKVKSWIRRS